MSGPATITVNVGEPGLAGQAAARALSRLCGCERDWARWLPPAPLPESGFKVFRAGQVWASRTLFGHAEIVRFIAERDDDDCLIGEQIAGSGLAARAGIYGGSSWAVYAVLVQDVGEADPRDPATLYGAATKLAKAPAGGTAAREMGTPDEGSEAERGQPAAGGKRATEDARGASPAKLPPATAQTICARITRAGIACDLTAGHPDECRPLHRERVSPVGVTEAELAFLASKGLVSARPDLSPYNRQPVGVSAGEIAALAAGWRAARRGAGGRR